MRAMENGVNFSSEEQMYANRGGGARKGSLMVGWVMKLTGTKSEQTANYILFGFAIVVLIISAIIAF